jgi:hypothetical protein
MKQMKKLLVVLTGLLFVAACSGTGQEDTLTKEEAAKRAKADDTRDYCAENGWYGDGVCDDFCLDPDPDCDGGCHAQGGKFEDMNPEGKCCPGLKPVQDQFYDTVAQMCLNYRCPCFVCINCGDGVCDEGENQCTCPDDCPACLQEGKGFEDFNTEGKCCGSLVPVPDASYNDVTGECEASRCPCFVCTACGDGVCGLAENQCNCPEDCLDSCVGEGQGFEDFNIEGKCCDGLVPVPEMTLNTEWLECEGTRCPCFVCTSCGDDLCGSGENPCNCPEDCAEKCGGFAGLPCPDGKVCIDDPTDSCYPDAGGADCMGICVEG